MLEAGSPDVSLFALLAALLLSWKYARYEGHDVESPMLMLQVRGMRLAQTPWNGHVTSQILEGKACILS